MVSNWTWSLPPCCGGVACGPPARQPPPRPHVCAPSVRRRPAPARAPPRPPGPPAPARAPPAPRPAVAARPGVLAASGSSPFGAEDVVASFHHVAWVPNSPGRLTTNTGSIAETRIVDPLTLHFVTRAPTPLLPNDLSGIPIINRRFAEAPTADFNSGAAAIGTGPYTLASFSPNECIELVRNDAYWGEREPWEKVSLRLLTNAATRVTALLAGDVDLIDSVPTAQIARLRADSQVGLFPITSNRVINLMLDH